MSVFGYFFIVIVLMLLFGYLYDKRKKSRNHYDERYYSNQTNVMSEQYNSESITRINNNSSGRGAN